MTEYDRGAYTPHADAPLAFDPRSPRERRPIPMTLVASAAILVVLVGAVAMAYRHGTHGGAGATRTVGAPVGAVKTIAAPDAQPRDPAAQLDVYAPQNVVATPAFAPAPEAPAPRPAPEHLQVQAATPPLVRTETPPAATAASPTSPATQVSRGAADQDAPASARLARAHPAPAIRTAEAVAPPTAPAKPSAHAGTLTIASAEAADATIDAALARARATPAAERTAASAPAAVATAPSTPTRPRASAALRSESSASSIAHKAKAVVARPATSKTIALRAEPPSASVRAEAAIKRAKPAKPIAAATPAVAAHGKAVAQIGAFGSRTIADTQLAELSALTGGHGRAISPVSTGGKTLYRTSVTGFADRAAASAFCARLAAAGHACIVKG